MTVFGTREWPFHFASFAVILSEFWLGGLGDHTAFNFLITDCNAGLNVNDLNTDRCLTFDYKSELNVIDYKYNLNT